MKLILKHFTIDTVSLYLASNIVSGIVFNRGIETLLLAGIGLSLASLVVKPVINIFMLPLNLITFGFFRWVSSAVAIYLVALVVPGFEILKFDFSGFQSIWFNIPAMSFEGVIAYIAFSFLISIISGSIYWLAN